MESRLHAFLNFWGLILGAAIGAAALIWTGSRARQTAEIAQVVSELKLQNERVNQEIQRSRAETERWKSEAEQLRRRLEQRPTHSQPPEKPICPPSLPETIPPPPEEAGSTTKQTQPRTVAKTRLNQISYEVVGCKGQERVTCDLMLTNHDQDRWFHIDPKTSYMIDDSGDQYYGTEAQIVRKASDRWQNLKTLLVSGVTVRSSITFDGVAVHAKRLSLLDLSVSSSTAGDHHVQFRNVALVKSQ